MLLLKKLLGNISQVAEIANLCKNNLNIYSGNDDQIVPILSLGGIGVISVLSNIIPKDVCNIVKYFLNRNTNEALLLQLETLNLTKALFSETNPIPIKAALNFIGYNVGIPRLPLVEMSEVGKEFLKSELETYSLL